MTDFADEAQAIEEAERDTMVAEIRRKVAAPPSPRLICAACSEPIEPDRLAANPAARRCLQCQEDFERLRRLHPKG